MIARIWRGITLAEKADDYLDYLRETAEKHKVFGDLFDLSTLLIPRSALPKLPPEVERTMSFHYAPR